MSESQSEDSKTEKEKPNTFALHIEEKKDLQRAYMPFVADGGLFIRTPKTFELGDEVFANLRLLHEPEKYDLRSKVIWLTPKNAQGGQARGMGVQLLGEQGIKIRQKIETYLAGKSNQPTDTI